MYRVSNTSEKCICCGTLLEFYWTPCLQFACISRHCMNPLWSIGWLCSTYVFLWQTAWKCAALQCLRYVYFLLLVNAVSIWHQMSSIQSIFLYVLLTCGLCSRLNSLRWLPITVLRRTPLNVVTLPEFWFNVYLHCLMWLFRVAELRVVSFVCHTPMWLCVCPMLMRRSRTSFHNAYFIVIQILELHISCS